jgi:dTDP-6-deoxy-L-talose 4-dehydrogenase (NAD+)
MTVVVTGAGGFIGAEVARALVERGARVIAPLRATTDRRRLVPLAGRIETVEVDLEDRSSLERMLRQVGPATVIHLAWYVHPRDYLDSRANLTALRFTTDLVELAIAAGCRKLVGIGSGLEYAPSPRPVCEHDAVGPTTLYAACKHSAWLVSRALARASAVELAWARVFHLYGGAEHPARIMPSVIRSLLAGRPIDLTAGDQVRDVLHVADVADAIARLAEPGVEGVFNVCSGVPVALRDFLLSVADVVGPRELLRFGARTARPSEPSFLVGDARKLRAIGWSPRHRDVSSAVRETIAEQRL